MRARTHLDAPAQAEWLKGDRREPDFELPVGAAWDAGLVQAAEGLVVTFFLVGAEVTAGLLRIAAGAEEVAQTGWLGVGELLLEVLEGGGFLLGGGIAGVFKNRAIEEHGGGVLGDKVGVDHGHASGGRG